MAALLQFTLLFLLTIFPSEFKSLNSGSFNIALVQAIVGLEAVSPKGSKVNIRCQSLCVTGLSINSLKEGLRYSSLLLFLCQFFKSIPAFFSAIAI